MEWSSAAKHATTRAWIGSRDFNGRQKQADFWVQGMPGLLSDFQKSQSCKRNPVWKIRSNERSENQKRSDSCQWEEAVLPNNPLFVSLCRVTEWNSSMWNCLSTTGECSLPVRNEIRFLGITVNPCCIRLWGMR